MKYRIYAGLGGGFGGASYVNTIDVDSWEEANDEAYNAAVEVYESYEGLHGIPSYNELREEVLTEYINENLTKQEIEDAISEVRQELIESWVDYYVEEDDGEDEDYDDEWDEEVEE